MRVSFTAPDISGEEIDEVVDTLKSGWITTGLKTRRFEEEISKYCGTRNTVCLNSATAALYLTLRLFGVGPGDEVVTSAYTYTASASVIVHVGATPVLVDTAKGSYEMDPAGLERAISRKTKAVIPVDIGGIPCEYNEFYKVLESARGLFSANNEMQSVLGRPLLLSDAAHSFGSSREGKKTGALADVTCFSFHAVKNLTTAEGGCVTWRDEFPYDSAALSKEFKLLSLHGQTKDALEKTTSGAWEYDIISPYYKCNMTDIMSSLGLAQLRRYPEMLEKRRKLAGLYDSIFENMPVEPLKHHDEHFVSNRHLYMLGLTGRDETERNAVISSLNDMGVSANVHFKPLPLLSAYKNIGFHIDDYPNAYAQYAKELSLPLHTLMTDDDAAYVAECLSKCLRS